MPVYGKKILRISQPIQEAKIEPIPQDVKPDNKPLNKQVVKAITIDTFSELSEPPSEPKVNLKQLIKEKLKKLETEEEEKGSGIKSKKIIKKLITGSGLKVIE